MSSPRTPEERLLAKLVLPDENGCWVWTGLCSTHGYGKIGVGRKLISVHRLAYELWVGPIPEGLTVDHVWERGCRSKLCCNPEHLEAVTRAENLRRHYARITHCPAGHEYTDENTYVYDHPRGYKNRHCITCLRDRTRAARQLQKELKAR